MKTIIKSLIIAGLATATYAKSPASAPAENLINAQRVSNINIANISPNDSIWRSAKTASVILYPQTTIKLNDAKANAANKDNKAKVAKVSAVYNNSAIAFKITWKDDTQSVQNGYKSDVYPDGFAMQVPVSFNDPKKLPYIGMGSEGRPVLVHLTKAVSLHYEPNGNGDIEHQINPHNTNAFGSDLKNYDDKVNKLGKQTYSRAFISEGFRSMTEIKDGSDTFGMKMVYDAKNKTWTGVVAKKLRDGEADLSKYGAIPVSFAIWDGDKLNRGGVKRLSSWVAVKLQGKAGGDALVKELTSKPKGDAKAGQAQVEAMCASCHTLSAAKQATSAYMAPNLNNIGGYSTNAYLAESIKDPEAVVVPGYNRNAHKSLAWYNLDAKTGKRTTIMPPMMSDDKSINDAVAYLKTLKAEVEK
ncbi:MAG: ethylbenzene dehydrogenase-related protein [Sulfurovaceae bacterium]|nr:ethylbenzene dehydrogenase-related protein [Sulfurovaceae bacterium]